MSLPEVHLVGGTCADAVRLAPVVTAMRAQGLLEPIVVATGPDPLAFAGTLGHFGVAVDTTLPVGADDATISRLDRLWAARTPRAVLVQGTGPAALPAALAAHWRRVPVVHLDAGRRSGDLSTTCITETNRRLLAQVTTVHLAAAPLAAMNLLDERVAGGDVLLIGNTTVEAAAVPRRSTYADPALAALRGSGSNRLLLVGIEHTSGITLDFVLAAVRRIAAHDADLDVVVIGADPAGRSPRIVGAMAPTYPDRARLLADAYLILTDDGDLQEEGLSFGVPSLVLRSITDRMEPVYAGSARLVGTNPASIFAETTGLLDSPARRGAMAAGGNPYGDGLAAHRAAQATAALLGHGQFPDPMPARSVAGASR